jgi:hypothetical protein
MTKHIHLGGKILFILAVLGPFSLQAQQAEALVTPQNIELEDVIRGNQEQPKVLTIVPWQSPKEKQALPSLISQRLDKAFQALERAEFQREIQFFDSYEKIHKGP